MKSLLPVIFIVLLLIGAITYSLSKRVIPKQEESRFGIAANKLETGYVDNTKSDTATKTGLNFVTPTPSATPKVTPKVTPTPTPTIVVEAKATTLPDSGEEAGDTKGGVTATAQKATKTVTTTTKTVVCTPVYGQANTCTEHVVVDTGAADAIFFNFAGLSYLVGLASFILAKRA